MKSPMIKLAAAAMFMVAVLAGLVFLIGKKFPHQPLTKNSDTQTTEMVISEGEGQPEITANNSGLVPIDINLPKALFISTPVSFVGIDNLEKPLGQRRPPFLAPAGITNVALNKPVTSSDKFPLIGKLSYITDGNKESYDGTLVELSWGVQNITIDLKTMYEIYAIVIWHIHMRPNVFFDVVVQTADDGNFIENAHTLFNNDTDNSVGFGIGKDMHYIETNEGKLIDVKGVKARYIRLYSNGDYFNGLNSYTEVEVYGRPEPAEKTNLVPIDINLPKIRFVSTTLNPQQKISRNLLASYLIK